MLQDKSSSFIGSLLLAIILPTHAYLAPRTLRPNVPHVSSLTWSSQSRRILGNRTSTAGYNTSSYLDSAGIATEPRSLAVTSNPLISQHDTSSRLFIDHFFNVSCGTRSTTSSGYAFPDFSQYCVLWDDSCLRSRSWTFPDAHPYTYLDSFELEVCFGNPFCQCMVDGVLAPAASTSSYAELLKFMRSPQCLSSPASCCQYFPCIFEPTAVELYYWPDPDADTSCLSIIGDSIYPWDYGATTTTFTEYSPAELSIRGMGSIQTYWGCAKTYMTTYSGHDYSTYSGIDASSWLITEIVTTAVMESIQGLKFKSSKFNPWEADQPCPKTFSGSTPSGSLRSLPSGANIHARSLESTNWEPTDLTKNRNDTPISVVTLDGHTL